MPFTVGETVGPYRITQELGQGGMATVYKAYHASLDRYVAIKVLHPAFKDDENFYVRFQREAQIVARLDHPHIVPIYDFAADQVEPYIVMKFIEGQTLKARLKENPLTLHETLNILPAVASALTYAHSKGILHRDVKTSNVMLDNDGTPYLTDFGLARIASSGESTMSQDVLIGTPNYISPEQARGEKNLSPATDIYSLGIMLYEIVVGRVPYTADTPYAVVHDHIYKPLPIPSKVNPTVPLEVEAVLLKALSKNPEDRYQSAVELAEAFQAAVEKSDLQELSAASLQLDRFAETAATVTPTPTKQELESYIKQAVEAELKARSGSTPAVSAPYPAAGRRPARRPRDRAQRGMWIVIGLAVLVFVCIAAVAVSINALQNPVVRSQPTAEAEATAVVSPSPPPPEELHDYLTVAEAQAWVEREPDNPVVHLSLALSLQTEGQSAAAEQTVAHVLQDLNPSAALLMETAEVASQRGYARGAVVLGLAAYGREPTNASIRNEAGKIIYRDIAGVSGEDLLLIQNSARLYGDTGFAKAMLAQALLYKYRGIAGARLEQARILLDEAIEQGDAPSEVHLVYGNYYALQGDLDSAREAWRYAASFEDTPPWIQLETEVRLKADAAPN